jgi:acyl carrier protein
VSEVDRQRVLECVTDGLAAAAQRAGLDAGELDEGFDVLGSGLVDSLMFVDLLIAVEERLGSPLALEQLDFEAIDNLGSLVDQLHALQDSVASPAPGESLESAAP